MVGVLSGLTVMSLSVGCVKADTSFPSGFSVPDSFTFPCSDSANEPNFFPATVDNVRPHFYATGYTFMYQGQVCVEGRSFKSDGTIIDTTETNPNGGFALSLFTGNFSKGWYYYKNNGSYYRCSGGATVPGDEITSITINGQLSEVEDEEAVSGFLMTLASTSSPVKCLLNGKVASIIEATLYEGDPSDFPSSTPVTSGNFDKNNSYYVAIKPTASNYTYSSSVTTTSSGWSLVRDDSTTVYLLCPVRFVGDDPSPSPSPSGNTKKRKTEKKDNTYKYLVSMISEKQVEEKPVIVDRDTYKSDAPSKTVISTDVKGADELLDIKVHHADEKTTANQKLLAQMLVGSNVQILLTENIYPRRDLSTAENGSVETLTWNNDLPKNQPGPVYAVVYNQIDGAYVITGYLDANGVATFSGFKLRSASTITICR